MIVGLGARVSTELALLAVLVHFSTPGQFYNGCLVFGGTAAAGRETGVFARRFCFVADMPQLRVFITRLWRKRAVRVAPLEHYCFCWGSSKPPKFKACRLLVRREVTEKPKLCLCVFKCGGNDGRGKGMAVRGGLFFSSHVALLVYYLCACQWPQSSMPRLSIFSSYYYCMTNERYSRFPRRFRRQIKLSSVSPSMPWL